jgi:hypothetical protein
MAYFNRSKAFADNRPSGTVVATKILALRLTHVK